MLPGIGAGVPATRSNINNIRNDNNNNNNNNNNFYKQIVIIWFDFLNTFPRIVRDFTDDDDYK